MKKKILFLQPLHEKLSYYGIRRRFIFPYGLAYLSTILLDNDYEVEIFDAHAEQLSKEKVMEKLKGKEFDILGISAFSTQYNAVKIISKFVKEELGKKVIIGGPLGTYNHSLTLERCCVDAVVLGEAEKNILDLLRYLDNPEKLIKVRGIAFKKDGKIVKTEEQEYIQNLDLLPKPAYHMFDMKRYLAGELFETRYVQLNKQKKYLNKKIMTVFTSRGCPYSCRFCSRNYRGARFMSINRVINELKYFKEKYNIDGVHFSDELFIFSQERMEEFVNKLRPLNLFWSAQARVNLINEKIMKIIKDGGCTGIGLGIESGSQKILNNMAKMITVSQIEKVMKAAKKVNLGVKVQLIFGYPGEDEQTIQETIGMFKRIDHPGKRFNLITPIPGSPLYDECIEKGIITDEDKYLIGLEKSFGKDKVQINFTQWSDDELTKKMKETEKIIKENYFSRNLGRFMRWKLFKLQRLIKGKFNGLKLRIKPLLSS
ncbi:B12-binding domain-containing radical SAM protein [Patescibacteria group bacterium]|nr:B12-binding domain-containing radical SAM protein [Patescibacteria group bacterium]